MLIKITVERGVVIDVETSEAAAVQIVDTDCDEISTFETVAQAVKFEDDPEEETLSSIRQDGLLNHDVMNDPLHTLFETDSEASANKRDKFKFSRIALASASRCA